MYFKYMLALFCQLYITCWILWHHDACILNKFYVCSAFQIHPWFFNCRLSVGFNDTMMYEFWTSFMFLPHFNYILYDTILYVILKIFHILHALQIHPCMILSIVDYLLDFMTPLCMFFEQILFVLHFKYTLDWFCQL